MRFNALALVPLLLVPACADEPVAPLARRGGEAPQLSQGGVVHRATAGGPDMCNWLGGKPGCDGNYSLIAMEMADGSVTGEWTDQFGPDGGMHAVVTCLKVGPHPLFPGRLEAWVGGVVTRPPSQAGHPVITRLRDNGVSAKDLGDAIGRSIVDPEEEGLSANCQDEPASGFGRVSQGQVKIW